MQNINLGHSNKKRFTIDGDENRVLELDTSDVNILTRATQFYKRTVDLEAEFMKLSTMDITGDNAEEAINLMDSLEKRVRESIDYVFNTNVCEVVCPNESLFAPVNGVLRYEFIITTLLEVCQKDIEKEYKKVASNVNKHTDKYTKKK